MRTPANPIPAPLPTPVPAPTVPPAPETGPGRTGFIRTWVAGYDYHPAVLHPGDPVQVKREPDNLHDANAIAVCNAKGVTAGYLPRYDAEYLAPLLDQEILTLEARLLPPGAATGDERIPVILRVILAPAGLALLEPVRNAATPAALLHNLFAAAWRDFPRFNPGPLQQLREMLRPIAHGCALKPVTKLLYRLLKEPLTLATAAEPPVNPFL